MARWVSEFRISLAFNFPHILFYAVYYPQSLYPSAGNPKLDTANASRAQPVGDGDICSDRAQSLKGECYFDSIYYCAHTFWANTNAGGVAESQLEGEKNVRLVKSMRRAPETVCKHTVLLLNTLFLDR